MAFALAGALALPMIFSMGDAALAAPKPVVLEVAFNQPETHPQFQAMKKMGEALKQRTGGRYTIEVFPNELLGAQKETVEMVQTGTIAMSITAGSLLESWNPDFSVFNLRITSYNVCYTKLLRPKPGPRRCRRLPAGGCGRPASAAGRDRDGRCRGGGGWRRRP